ncbi:MAG: hypothetical protein HC871_16380 [Rhizobiales bacterium]|nr:hypothetical protein [Hyphomicrobiales bacterium]
MSSTGNPLWLLAPLLAFAVIAIGRRELQLPGAWRRAIQRDLQAFLAATVEDVRSPFRRAVLVLLWLLLGAALARMSLGHVDMPQLRNLDARVVVIDLGLTDADVDRVAAARYLIESADNVPTAVVAVTERAFDVVPITRDDAHLDRYLQVLTRDIMPIEGRSLATGIERAMALLDRGAIQARQIAVFTGGMPPGAGRLQAPGQDADQNVWLVLPDGDKPAWQEVADDLGVPLIGDQESQVMLDDFEQRRQAAAAKAVSVRERQDITPWLIAFTLPLWLLLFFRRRPE